MPGISQGNISAMVADANYVYFLDNTWAGEFGGSPALKKFVRFDGQNYEQLGGLFQCQSCGTGYQNSMIMDAAGNIYIGGAFQGANNADGTYVESQNLIKWNTSSNEWEKISNGINSLRINALEIISDTLYIGGQRIISVTQPNSTTLDVSLVAAMNLNTLEWSAMDGGVFQEFNTEPIVYDIEADGLGRLFIGGSANQAGSDAINYFSVIVWDPADGTWNTTGGLPYYFTEGATAQSSTVHSLEYDVENDLMYAGGYFGRYASSRGFAAYDGTSWSIIGGIGQRGTTPFFVWEIYKDPLENKVYVGGTFNKKDATDGNTVGNGIGIYDPVNSTWETNPFNGGVTGNGASVKAFQRFNDDIYFGGDFDAAGAFNANNLARWDGTACDVLGNGILSNNSTINDVVEWNEKIIVGGQFSIFATDTAYSLAMYDPVTDIWTEISGGIKNQANGPGVVNDLFVDGDLLHVGGDFYGVDDIATNDFATYDLINNSWITYGPGVANTNGARVYTITSYMGDLVIGGNISAVDGQSVNNLAFFDGSSWTSPGVIDQPVYSLFADDAVLYLGGQFSSINGNSSFRKIGAYYQGNFHPMGRGLDNNVLNINKDPTSGAILIGGIFGKAFDNENNPLTVDALVAWNDSTWLPFASIIDGSRRIEEIIVEEDSTIFIVGRFGTLNGTSFSNLAFFDGCEFYNMGPGISGEGNIIKGLAQIGNRLFVGGSFNNAGEYPSYGFGAFEFTTTPTLSDCQPVVDLDESYFSCENSQDTLSLTAGYYGYEWNTGSDSSTAVFNSSGVYDVTVYSELGYAVKDTFEFVYEIPQEFTLGNDTTLIGGFSITAPDDPFYSYEWNTGDSTHSINVYQTGAYGLNLITRGGCISSDSIVVDITALPGYAGGTGSGYVNQYNENLQSVQFYSGGTGSGYVNQYNESLQSIQIYSGGTGQGSDNYVFSNSSVFDVYGGGPGDGSDLFIYLNPDQIMAFQGGANDGYGQKTYNNPAQLLIFSGGMNDGASNNNFSNPQALNIYAGGVNDGYYLTNYENPESLELFQGGHGHGYQKQLTKNSKSLDIYEGGQADGYSKTYYLQPKVLEATRKANERSEIKVFPNPVTLGHLMITLPKNYRSGEVRLVDLQGRNIWQDQFTNSKQIHLDLSDSLLERGLYILLIQAENDKYEAKVIYHY